jgi:hypothetical protein
MSLSLPLLFLGITLAFAFGATVWYFTQSSHALDKRREELLAKRMSRQPWDAQSADGRGNR